MFSLTVLNVILNQKLLQDLLFFKWSDFVVLHLYKENDI